MPTGELITLRILHIVFGVFWAGSAIFFAAILQPRLHTLDLPVRLRVLGALIPVMGPVLISSAVVTILAGTALALRMRWDNLEAFVDTGWGIAMLVGLAASVGAITSGITMIRRAGRMVKLGGAVVDGSASPEVAEQVTLIGARLPRLARSTAVMVLVAIVTMAVARFV